MISLMLLASAISGSPVTIENCAIRREWLRCDVTNVSETAVASIAFSATAHEPGRTVPWAEIEHQWQPVSGGIEPGETRELMMMFSPPEQATELDIKPLAAFDVTRELIGSFDQTPLTRQIEIQGDKRLEDALTDALGG